MADLTTSRCYMDYSLMIKKTKIFSSEQKTGYSKVPYLKAERNKWIFACYRIILLSSKVAFKNS